MISIVDEAPAHIGAREALLDLSFGPDRTLKTSERLREGRLPVFAYSALDADGRLTGTVRLWSVSDPQGNETLLLGPLAVDPCMRGHKVGDRLMRHALNQAALGGYGSILLVGDAAYYSRFGFEPGLLDDVCLPGPVERARFLAVELAPGHLFGLYGELRAAGFGDPAANHGADPQSVFAIQRL
ncbi:putative N-acetyltransferase YhbS [Roseibium hamelinense]|uniref:Putative N-acetyltransferase YhbS n=1 Tax=Roseibium hamelinense TaxID=150831 RepID=A0A562TI59_9HYPH|nr:N-acetyltransferase [Roseibium hamelinense]MTI42743.1 N-acetyltransferase [Roseibium hamelinense]TWI93389.1 putative N-acetyltransferase YhbS [Roseibium hamelinense]